MSRMVKFDFSPTSSAWRRRMLDARARGRCRARACPRRRRRRAWPTRRLHLARRLVGEGDGEDLVRARPAGVQQVGDAGGQRPGLAGAGAGEHQHRAVERLDRRALRRGSGRRGRAPAARPRRGPTAGAAAASKASASSLVQVLMRGEGNRAARGKGSLRSRCVRARPLYPALSSPGDPLGWGRMPGARRCTTSCSSSPSTSRPRWSRCRSAAARVRLGARLSRGRGRDRAGAGARRPRGRERAGVRRVRRRADAVPDRARDAAARCSGTCATGCSASAGCRWA